MEIICTPTPLFPMEYIFYSGYIRLRGNKEYIIDYFQDKSNDVFSFIRFLYIFSIENIIYISTGIKGVFEHIAVFFNYLNF